MLRLELLNLKKERGGELVTLSLHCHSCGRDVHWVFGLGVAPGHWGPSGARAARRARRQTIRTLKNEGSQAARSVAQSERWPTIHRRRFNPGRDSPIRGERNGIAIAAFILGLGGADRHDARCRSFELPTNMSQRRTEGQWSSSGGRFEWPPCLASPLASPRS
jgi:hypothetical protein